MMVRLVKFWVSNRLYTHHWMTVDWHVINEPWENFIKVQHLPMRLLAKDGCWEAIPHWKQMTSCWEFAEGYPEKTQVKTAKCPIVKVQNQALSSTSWSPSSQLNTVLAASCFSATKAGKRFGKMGANKEIIQSLFFHSFLWSPAGVEVYSLTRQRSNVPSR